MSSGLQDRKRAIPKLAEKLLELLWQASEELPEPRDDGTESAVDRVHLTDCVLRALTMAEGWYTHPDSRREAVELLNDRGSS